MKLIIIFLSFIIHFSALGQNDSANTLYILDSIPVFKGFNKVEGEDILEVDVYSINSVTDSLKLVKFKEFNIDTIIYVITKRYAERPDSIKLIPSMRQMLVIDNKWCLKKSRKPYSGNYIDYYLNGQIEGEGTIINGRLDGKHLRYYKNGNVSKEHNYNNGTYVDVELSFYKNGKIQTIIESKNNKLHGKWESYYPNGNIKIKSTFKNGKVDGKTIFYSSNGRPTGFNKYNNGIKVNENADNKITILKQEGFKLFHSGNLRSSIKKYNKMITLDSLNSDAYLSRAKAKIGLLSFENALQDLNKAINIEPFLLEAYMKRGFLKIKMFGSSPDSIPVKELNRICADFEFFESYANYYNVKVKQAMKKYCE